jgi:hypothetical protein
MGRHGALALWHPKGENKDQAEEENGQNFVLIK